MAEACCDLKLNPDITGIGVRAALYAQIMLGWFMSLVWPETYVKNSRTAYMTATALLVASFIELETQALSLLDGLIVSMITSMMITFAIASNSIPESASTQGSTTPNSPAPSVPVLNNTAPGNTAPDSTAPNNTVTEKPTQNDTTQGDTTQGDAVLNDPAPKKSQSDNPHRSVTRSFIQFCFTIFWAAWSFNLWKDPAHFGLRGERANCPPHHDVTLSVFGREIDATDPRMRNAALALVSIGFFIALCSICFSLEQVIRPFARLMRGNKQQATSQTTQAAGQTTQASRKIKTYDNDPILLGAHFFLQSIAIATLIYLTVSTEKTISKNDVDRETRNWSYGQTIALILLLQQVMDVFSTWIEKREKKEMENERRAREV